MLQFPDKTNVPNLADVMDRVSAMHANYLKNISSNLANQRDTATLPYAGPQAAASLAGTQAGTNLTNVQASLAPQLAMAKKMAAVASLLKGGNPVLNQKYWRQSVGDTAADNVVSHNPQDYADSYNFAKILSNML